MRINEIFYSLQGEGFFMGTPAVFIRFSGCNMACPFCDTDHESHYEATVEDIITRISEYPSRHVVITGGEPSLQLTADFVDVLHAHGYFVQVETNGTMKLSDNVDWITCSPKNDAVVYDKVNELKVVYQGREQNMTQYDGIAASVYCLQPCDVKDDGRNADIVSDTIEYIKAHPKWRLSLQTHKILNVR